MREKNCLINHQVDNPNDENCPEPGALKICCGGPLFHEEWQNISQVMVIQMWQKFMTKEIYIMKEMSFTEISTQEILPMDNSLAPLGLLLAD